MNQPKRAEHFSPRALSENFIRNSNSGNNVIDQTTKKNISACYYSWQEVLKVYSL